MTFWVVFTAAMVYLGIWWGASAPSDSEREGTRTVAKIGFFGFFIFWLIMLGVRHLQFVP